MWSENGFEKTVPETWAEFDQRVREGMKLLTDSVTAKQKILVVSSGGAISMALSHVLKAPAETMIQLNLQTRNSSVSHCFYSNTAISLSSFNHLPHLEQADRRYAITYA